MIATVLVANARFKALFASVMVILGFCPCGVLGGDALTADEQRLADAMREYSASLAEMVQAEIKEEGLRRPGVTASLQKWLKQLEREPFQVPKLCTWKLKVGRIGYLVHDGSDTSAHNFKVLQVIDAKNLLIHIQKGVTANEVNVGILRPETIIWVSGVDTAGVTDDTYVSLPQLFEVTGTRQYETALGTKTVFVVSPFAVQDLGEVMRKAKPPQRQKDKPAAEPSGARELRTWTDATGKFTIRGTFSGIIGGKVLLVKEDGTKVYVTREQLSEADRKHLDEIAKK